jgi:hypothetical protein
MIYGDAQRYDISLVKIEDEVSLSVTVYSHKAFEEKQTRLVTGLQMSPGFSAGPSSESGLPVVHLPFIRCSRFGKELAQADAFHVQIRPSRQGVLQVALSPSKPLTVDRSAFRCRVVMLFDKHWRGNSS